VLLVPNLRNPEELYQKFLPHFFVHPEKMVKWQLTTRILKEQFMIKKIDKFSPLPMCWDHNT